MKIEVKDAVGTIISTGIMTEMGPYFSPAIPTQLHAAFSQYVEEHPQKQSGTWEARVGGKVYILQFAI